MKYLWLPFVLSTVGCADQGDQSNVGKLADEYPNGLITHVAFAEKGNSLVVVNEFRFYNKLREKCHARMRRFRTSDWMITADSGELSVIDFTLAASGETVWGAEAQAFYRDSRGNPTGGVVLYKVEPETLRLKPAVVIKEHEASLRPSALAGSSAKPVCAVHWEPLVGKSRSPAFLLDLANGQKIVDLEDFPTEARDAYFTKTVLEFTPAGKHVISCYPCRPFQLQLHAADTGKLVASKKLDSPATAIKFSPDGRILAALCLDGTVLVLAADLSKKVHSFTVDKHGDGYASPQSMVFPENEILAIVSGRKKIEFYDTKDWKSVRTIAVEKNQVNCIASSPDGKLIAAGLGRYLTYPTQVRIFEIKTGKLVKELD